MAIQSLAGLRRNEGFQLMLAALLQARRRAAKRRPTVAGVHHQLRASLRQYREQLHQLGSAKTAGDLETGEMVGGPAAVPRQHPMEPAPQETERGIGGALQRRD